MTEEDWDEARALEILNEDQLNSLQWAKEFMDKYEKKHKSRTRQQNI